MNCACKCPPEAHAPVQDFGIAMCLMPGCDCDGPTGQVGILQASRRNRMSSTADKIYRTVLEVLSRPRDIDDQARNIAAAIVANFECEER